MTAKFNFATPENERLFVFEGIKGRPSIRTIDATERNSKYFDAFLKRSRKNVRRAKAAGVTTQMIQEARESDYKLFPQFVAKGFEERPLLSDGSPAGDEHMELFFRSIPVHMFDDYRDFCQDINNFMPEEEDLPDEEEVEDLVGN